MRAEVTLNLVGNYLGGNMIVTLNLDELSNTIREGIAAQTSDKNTLDELAGDPEAEIRARVALNPWAASYTIDKLKRDPNPIVQSALRRRGSDKF